MAWFHVTGYLIWIRCACPAISREGLSRQVTARVPPVPSCLLEHTAVTLPWSKAGSQKNATYLVVVAMPHTCQAGQYRGALHVGTRAKHRMPCAGAAPSQCSAPSARPSQSPGASSAACARLQSQRLRCCFIPEPRWHAVTCTAICMQGHLAPISSAKHLCCWLAERAWIASCWAQP